MDGWMILIGAIVIIGSPVLGIYLYVKAYGGENGERYRKMQTQGHFLPINDQDQIKAVKPEDGKNL